MESKALNITAGVLQGLLSVGLGMPGIMKIITPYESLVADPNMAWAADFSPLQIQVIAVLEILGVIGLNLPYLLKKFKKLVPISAAGLALTMIGAIVTHAGRGENFIPPLVLLLVSLFVAYARKDLLKS